MTKHIGFGKVDRVICNKEDVKIISRGKRVWSIAEDVTIWVWFKNGQCLTFFIQAGFYTDFRSGPILVDYIVPKIGGRKPLLCWLVHDILYYDFDFISRESADMILMDMLIWAGYKWRSHIVYKVVCMAGEDNFGNTPETYTLPIPFEINKSFVEIAWS